MNLEYTLTLRDYKAAFSLHRWQKVMRRLLPWIGPILFLTSLAGFIVFSVNHYPGLAAQSLAFGAGSIVITIGIPISRSINIRRNFMRLYPPHQTDRKSSIEIDNEHILRRLSGVSELKVLWSGVYDVIQDEKVTMIYTNKDCFLLLPTQRMSSQERAELNGLVARHVIKR